MGLLCYLKKGDINIKFDAVWGCYDNNILLCLLKKKLETVSLDMRTKYYSVTFNCLREISMALAVGSQLLAQVRFIVEY